MLSIIVATDLNGGIGYKGDLLFKIKEDLKRFKELTTGHTVIMGRKTYESLPNGALPNRKNIVVTSQNIQTEDKIILCQDMRAIINLYEDSEEEVFVIGGGELYKQLLPYCNKIYLTVKFSKYYADTFFKFNSDEWDIDYWSKILDSEEGKYEFMNLIRKKIHLKG